MVQYFEYGNTEIEHLKKKDKRLGAYIDKTGMLKRKITPDLFDALVGSIISQQISGKAADTVYARLSALCEITPASIASIPLESIQSCGMSMRKASYIKNAADYALLNNDEFKAFRDMPDVDVIKALSSIKGIGVWTAEMMLIFSLARKDVVSCGDLGIKRGIMRLYGLSELTREDFSKYRKRYSPYGTVASFYLWEIAGNT